MAPLPAREPLPTRAEWLATLDLKRNGAEWHCPCPLCGGEDRFRVMRDGGVFCRVCLPDGRNGTRLAELLRTVFPERYGPAQGRSHDPLMTNRRCDPPRGPRASPPQRPESARQRNSRSAPTHSGFPDPKAALVARLWARSVPADASAGRVYLARRFAWPPHGIGPDQPATVRWLPYGAARGREPAAKWYGLPDGAVGALGFAWRRPGEADPAPVALTLMAVDAAGDRVTWPSRRRHKVHTVGERGGLAFEVRAVAQAALGAGFLVQHVAEGEADALALSLAPWCAAGPVYATGGTAGMRQAAAIFAATGSGPVVIHADAGAVGGGIAGYAQAGVQAAGEGAVSSGTRPTPRTPWPHGCTSGRHVGSTKAARTARRRTVAHGRSCYGRGKNDHRRSRRAVARCERGGRYRGDGRSRRGGSESA